MIVTDNKSASIVDKVMHRCKLEKTKRFDTSVLQYRPFALSSDFENSAIDTKEFNITVICSNERETYTDISMITSNKDKVDKYKVCAGKVNPDRGGLNGGKTYYKPFILNPYEVCSMTYLVLSVHDNIQEAKFTMRYIKTKFTRFLIRTTLSGMNITSRNYMFVPYEDFTNDSDIDQQLYRKYGLTQEEITT